MSLDFLGAITGLFVVVYDGQHALKFTLGRAGAVVGPGVHFKIPIFQKYVVEETKHTTLDLEPQVIQLKDDLVYEVDCKVMYQIFDLRRAIVEIDDLVTGLQNRVVMAVQRVVQTQDRETVRETDAMVDQIRAELRPMEEQWGVRILQCGFSNISPSPATLEITQLELLANERLALYGNFRSEGIGPEASVALLTGAVIATGASRDTLGFADQRREERGAFESAKTFIEEADEAKRPPATERDDPEEDDEFDDEDDDE